MSPMPHVLRRCVGDGTRNPETYVGGYNPSEQHLGCLAPRISVAKIGRPGDPPHVNQLSPFHTGESLDTSRVHVACAIHRRRVPSLIPKPFATWASDCPSRAGAKPCARSPALSQLGSQTSFLGSNASTLRCPSHWLKPLPKVMGSPHTQLEEPVQGHHCNSTSPKLRRPTHIRRWKLHHSSGRHRLE